MEAIVEITHKSRRHKLGIYKVPGGLILYIQIMVEYSRSLLIKIPQLITY